MYLGAIDKEDNSLISLALIKEGELFEQEAKNFDLSRIKLVVLKTLEDLYVEMYK